MNTQNKMKEDNVWLALVEVETINNNIDLGDASGAFVNVAYRASSKEEFISSIVNSFNEYDFNVLEIDDIESYDQIQVDNPENSEKISLVKKITDESLEFTWGDFHTFD